METIITILLVLILFVLILVWFDLEAMNRNLGTIIGQVHRIEGIVRNAKL